MRIKGLETSKNLLRLTGDYVESENSSCSDEEKKQDGVDQPHVSDFTHFEEFKVVELTELPTDYNLVEEVQDQEDTEQLAKLLREENFEATEDDRPSICSETIDDAISEQMRLQKLLERQQRILMAAKLLPDLSDFGDRSWTRSQASEALIEDVLSMSIFKQFLISQDHVAL